MNGLDPVLAKAHSLQGAQGRFSLFIVRLNFAVCLFVIILRLWLVYLVLSEEKKLHSTDENACLFMQSGGRRQLLPPAE